MNPYLELTREFNAGGLRAIVSSGQAVVLLRLSVASKDGDWIVRETPEALGHVLDVLARHGAHYRFGAPLDVHWMQGGWSAHLEFQAAGLRVRTDFVTRPPRLAPADLAELWEEQAGAALPCVDPRRLIALKQTGRERDYVVIGELVRRLDSPEQQLLLSRSPEDLIDLASGHAAAARGLVRRRGLLQAALDAERGALGAALDEERRRMMEADRRRLQRYKLAAAAWAALWPSLEREIHPLPLLEQHARVVERARGVLPPTAGEPL